MVATLLSIFSSFINEMAAQKERTFLMIKPDAVSRGLVGDIISRFERRGFKLVAMKFVQADKAVLEAHYGEHKGKKFYDPLLQYMLSGPVVPMVWEGGNIVALSRAMMGATAPANSNPGTIRGDYGIEVGRNIIHGSDKVETANREIALWFSDKEMAKWTRSGEEWLYE